MYDLTAAGVLANKLRRERSEEHGYAKVKHAPDLCKHETRQIWFTSTDDDFGVNYADKQHATHLMKVLKLYYKMKED